MGLHICYHSFFCFCNHIIISLLLCNYCVINRKFVNSWVLNTDMMSMRCLKVTQKEKLLEQEVTGNIL